MLRGEKVVLRGIRREDLPRLWELRNDLELQGLVSSAPPEPASLARLEAEFDKRASEGGSDGPDFAIEVEGMLIGRCGLYDLNEMARTCDLGIGIAREYWGQGYGRDAVGVLLDYAFRIRNLQRVALDVLADNERAIRSYVACGFVEEGRLRRHEWHEGRYKDSVQMGILREEWERSRAEGTEA